MSSNTKATIYTSVVLGVLILLCFLISWTPPQSEPIKEEEGMEVNLGDSETGSGAIEPLMPDDPAALVEQQSAAPPQPTPAPPEKEIETNDNDKEAPPAVIPPVKSTPKPQPSNKPTPPTPAVKNPPKEETKPVEVPPAPKPKALFKAASGTGKGGNNSDSYQPSAGQGIAGGAGNQGKPNGDPNSDSYTGNGGNGNGGVSVSRGLTGRKINRFPSFQDDFNENAKIAVDVRVDRNGNVIGATIQAKGTTTGNSSMKAIALQKARQLKFTPDPDGAEEQIGTIVFNFRVSN
ncbi:MAG: hypothetical protein RIQ50_255 [Bacteroidota bacterium]